MTFDFLPILNLILPLIAACFSLIKARLMVVITSALLVFNNILLLFFIPKNSLVLLEVLDGYKISLIFDSLSVCFALMVSILYFITNLYSFAFLSGQSNSELGKDLNPKIHFFFMPIAILATLGIGFSSNLLTLFVFYEILTLSTYPLVIQSFTDHARKAGKFYIVTLFGSSSFFLMLALILLDKNYGFSDFKQGGIFDDTIPIKEAIILLICFIFGFSKSAIFPLYKWLPKAMSAPIPVSALLHAVAVVKSGIFALIKVFVYLIGMNYLSALHKNIPWSIDWITYLACFTMVFAGFIACRQSYLKKILAYSTVSQLSYMILLLSLTTAPAFSAAFLLMLSHSIAKITLFFSAGIIYIALHKTDIEEMRGIVRLLPVTVIIFILAAFSIIGLPPSIGWLMKSKVLDSIICDNFIGSFAKTCILISSAMSCYYLLKPVYLMLLPQTEPSPIFYNTRTLAIITTLTFSLSMLLLYWFNDLSEIASKNY